MQQTVNLNQSLLSAFGTLETNELTPILQGDFTYGINKQLWNYSYVFTITSPSVAPTNGALYTNNNGTFVCDYTSGTTFVAFGSSDPSTTGTLTKVSGTGDATLTFSAFTTQAGIINNTGATIDTSVGRLRIQSGTNSAGYAFITAKKIVRYRAGMGTVARFTPVYTAGVASNVQYFGIGTISNNALYDGFYIGYNGTAFGIAYYNSGTLNWTPRTDASISSWNGDKCDGTGPSGFNWDPTKGTPVMIKYPFLGFGDIFFYVQNSITGSWILFHTIKYANTVAVPELSNPSLQFIGFTLNSGNTTNQSMYVASIGMFVSGSRNFISNPKWAIDSNKATITTETNLVTIRNCNTYNGVPNKGMIRLNSISFGTGNNSVATLRIKSNATLGGTPSYTPINGTTADNGVTITSGNSITSYDTAGTTVNGGNYLFNMSVGNTGAINIDLTPYDILLAPGEIATVSASATASSTIGCSVNWSEDI